MLIATVYKLKKYYICIILRLFIVTINGQTSNNPKYVINVLFETKVVNGVRVVVVGLKNLTKVIVKKENY